MITRQFYEKKYGSKSFIVNCYDDINEYEEIGGNLLDIMLIPVNRNSFSQFQWLRLRNALGKILIINSYFTGKFQV